jgi:hypothetical protein
LGGELHEVAAVFALALAGVKRVREDGAFGEDELDFAVALVFALELF